MLTHGNYIITLTPRTVINHASFHPGTEGANGILLHAVFGSLDNCVRLDPVWHLKRLQIGDKRLGLVFIDLRVNCHCSDFKFDWSYALEVL